MDDNSPNKVKDTNSVFVRRYIARTIKEQRLLHGFSQQFLASCLKIPPQQLQKYENGLNKISSDKLYTLSILFKIPMNDFFPPIYSDEEVNKGVVESGSSSRRIIELVRMFNKIENNKIKKQLYALIKSLAIGSNNIDT